jgi:hypothetical protein
MLATNGLPQAGSGGHSHYLIGTDAAVVTWPGRYFDERGITMWDTVAGILNRLEWEADRT